MSSKCVGYIIMASKTTLGIGQNAVGSVEMSWNHTGYGKKCQIMMVDTANCFSSEFHQDDVWCRTMSSIWCRISQNVVKMSSTCRQKAFGYINMALKTTSGIHRNAVKMVSDTYPTGYGKKCVNKLWRIQQSYIRQNDIIMMFDVSKCRQHDVG